MPDLDPTEAIFQAQALVNLLQDFKRRFQQAGVKSFRLYNAMDSLIHTLGQMPSMISRPLIQKPTVDQLAGMQPPEWVEWMDSVTQTEGRHD